MCLLMFHCSITTFPIGLSVLPVDAMDSDEDIVGIERENNRIQLPRELLDNINSSGGNYVM